ncbi:FG-GAP-like repeat-containing protein, partial [Celeribacter neptunius]
SYTAVVADAAGNEGTASAGFDVVVDTTAPVTTATIDTFTDDVGIYQADYPSTTATDDTAPVLNGTLDAALAAGEEVRIYEGTTLVGTATVAGTGWTLALSGLAEGTHSYTAVVADAAGNEGTASAGFDVVVDTTVPAAPVVTSFTYDVPGAGTGASGETTSDSTLLFNGTAEANALVEVFLQGVSIGTVTADASGNWTLDYTGTNIVDGDYVVTATQIDVAGNGPSVASGDFNITVDAVAAAPGFSLLHSQEPTLNVYSYDMATQTFSTTPVSGSSYSSGLYTSEFTFVSDVNGDGIQDWIWGKDQENVIETYLGNADGTFSTTTINTTVAGDFVGIDGTETTYLTDVTGDGVVDWVWIDQGATTGIQVYAGLGDGTFSTSMIQTTGFTNWGAGISSAEVSFLADVTGDGIVDYVYENDSANTGIQVWVGNGDGTFATTDITTAGVTEGAWDVYRSTFLADVNGDGNLDWLYAHENTGNGINVYLGNGDGTFQTTAINSAVGTYATTGFNVGWNANESTYLVDLTGDNILDLAWGYTGTDEIRIWAGNGDGTFATTYSVIDMSGISDDWSGGSPATYNQTSFLDEVGSDAARGTAGQDFLTGTTGADAIYEVGAGDTVTALDGDDDIQVADVGFALIDGGAGTDTLALSGGGLILDFSSLAGQVTEVEGIDLTLGAGNALIISDQEVLDLSSITDVLVVDGNGDDSVTASGGFTLSGTTTQGDVTYDVYDAVSGATLWIDQDIGTGTGSVTIL